MTVTTIDAAARPSATKTRGAVLRVLVVDALPLAAYALHALVGQSPGLAWCGAARSMEAAVGAVRDLHPDVVLVDSDLDPDAGGVRALFDAHPRVLVIGLVRDDRRTAGNYVKAARAARVHALVSRSVAPGVLVAAIRSVHDGHTILDPRLASLHVETQASGDAALPVPTLTLTGRQTDILALIARGLRNADIAEVLVVSVETVRTHVKEILRRLEARDRAHAVARGYQLGFIEAEPAIP